MSVDQSVEKARHKTPALRCEVADELIEACGDFVVKRADGLFAYQLAVVVDDLDQGVTDVVRGRDLLHSTDRQRYLASLLRPNVSKISYYHVPLMCDDDGVRLSKRDGSMSLSEYRENNQSASAVIGDLAHGLGVIDRFQPLSSNELLEMLFDDGDCFMKLLDS